MKKTILSATLLVSVFLVASYLSGCAKERPLPDDPHHHDEAVAGFVLTAEGVEVYRQFDGFAEGLIWLHEGEVLEVEVVFLNEEGEEMHLHYEREEGHDHEALSRIREEGHEEELAFAFTGFDGSILHVHAHHHDHDHTLTEEEEGLAFEMEGVGHGQTAFTLWLLMGDEVIFTSLAILVNVEDE